MKIFCRLNNSYIAVNEYVRPEDENRQEEYGELHVLGPHANPYQPERVRVI